MKICSKNVFKTIRIMSTCTTSVAVAPKIKLNDGHEMPVIGLGTYLSKPGEVEKAIAVAIEAGYRHIDTAYYYGNEKEVGAGIRAKIKDGTVTRADMFIVTKLWITFQTYKLAIKMCKESLNNLSLDYIDLFLIHWPVAIKPSTNLSCEQKSSTQDDDLKNGDANYLESWKGLEECIKLGYTKSIGVSNFNSEQIDKLLSVAKIKPVCNQVECSPKINQLKLIEFCKKRNIVIVAYSPFGKPGRSEEHMKKSPIYDTKISEMGNKYGKTAAQIVLRFLIQISAYPIPKSVTKERIIENFNIFDFAITDEDLEYLKNLNTNERTSAFLQHACHEDYPFNLEY